MPFAVAQAVRSLRTAHCRGRRLGRAGTDPGPPAPGRAGPACQCQYQWKAATFYLAIPTRIQIQRFSATPAEMRLNRRLIVNPEH